MKNFNHPVRTLKGLIFASLYASLCICTFGCNSNEPLACRVMFLDESKYDDYLECDYSCSLDAHGDRLKYGSPFFETIGEITATNNIYELCSAEEVASLINSNDVNEHYLCDTCVKLCKRANCDLAHNYFGHVQDNKFIEQIKQFNFERPFKHVMNSGEYCTSKDIWHNSDFLNNEDAKNDLIRNCLRRSPSDRIMCYRICKEKPHSFDLSSERDCSNDKIATGGHGFWSKDDCDNYYISNCVDKCLILGPESAGVVVQPAPDVGNDPKSPNSINSRTIPEREMPRRPVKINPTQVSE